MKLRGFSIFVLIFLSVTLHAQKIGKGYVTALDTLDTKHILTFNNNGTIDITYPRGPGVYWKEIINEQKTFSFSLNHDTISIFLENESIYTEFTEVEKRLLDSKFIVLGKKHLFDCKSGYFYITTKQAQKLKYGVVAFEGKVYIIGNRRNRALKKILSEYESEELTSKVVRGKSALDKYGILGIYGVIEIKRK